MSVWTVYCMPNGAPCFLTVNEKVLLVILREMVSPENLAPLYLPTGTGNIVDTTQQALTLTFGTSYITDQCCPHFVLHCSLFANGNVGTTTVTRNDPKRLEEVYFLTLVVLLQQLQAWYAWQTEHAKTLCRLRTNRYRCGAACRRVGQTNEFLHP